MTGKIGHLLCACAALSLTIETNLVSIFLFGEYPYPTEEQDD